MKDSVKFVLRLLDLKVPIPENWEIHSTRAKYLMRSAGGFTSMIIGSDHRGAFCIGMFEPIRKLLRCPNLGVDLNGHENSVDCRCPGGKCLGGYKFKQTQHKATL